MGRRVDVAHLVGAREAAQRLGLASVQVLHHLRRKDPRFPPAVYWTTPGQGGTGVWYWPDLWRWARRTARPEFADLGPLRPPGTRASRHIDVGDLVGTKQIAARLGLQVIQAVHWLWQSDPTFPAPVFVSNGGRWGTRLWAWPDVRRWALRSGRVLVSGGPAQDRPAES